MDLRGGGGNERKLEKISWKDIIICNCSSGTVNSVIKSRKVEGAMDGACTKGVAVRKGTEY